MCARLDAAEIGEIGSVAYRGWSLGLIAKRNVTGGTYDWRERNELWLTTDGRLVRWSVSWYGDTGEHLVTKKFAVRQDLRAMDLGWTDEVVPHEGGSGGTEHWTGARELPYGDPPYGAVVSRLEAVRTRALEGPLQVGASAGDSVESAEAAGQDEPEGESETAEVALDEAQLVRRATERAEHLERLRRRDPLGSYPREYLQHRAAIEMYLAMREASASEAIRRYEAKLAEPAERWGPDPDLDPHPGRASGLYGTSLPAVDLSDGFRHALEEAGVGLPAPQGPVTLAAGPSFRAEQQIEGASRGIQLAELAVEDALAHGHSIHQAFDLGAAEYVRARNEGRRIAAAVDAFRSELERRRPRRREMKPREVAKAMEAAAALYHEACQRPADT